MALGWNWRFWERERSGCGAIEPLLSLYVDHMASAAETRRVESHLATCAQCRQALEWMQATHQVIARRPIVAAPADLQARVARAIAEAQAAKRPLVPARTVPAPRRPLTLRPALAYGLSVAAFAVISGTVFWSAGHDQSHVVRTGSPLSPTPTQISGLPTAPITSHRATSPRNPLTHVSSVHGAVPGSSTIASWKPVEKSPAALRRHLPTPGPENRSVIATNPTAPSPVVVRIGPNYAVSVHLSHPGLSHHSSSVELARVPQDHTNTRLTEKHPTNPVAPAPDVQIANNVPNGGSSTPGPVNVSVSPPIVSHDPVQVAGVEHLSLNDQLHAIAGKIDQVSYTARKFEANEGTVATDTIAGLSSSSSGTAKFVYGDVH